jgi:hypothetical protein
LKETIRVPSDKSESRMLSISVAYLDITTYVLLSLSFYGKLYWKFIFEDHHFLASESSSKSH